MAGRVIEVTGVSRGAPTPEDLMWVETARESYKKSGERLQDYLQKLVTLAVALAGGGILTTTTQHDLIPLAARGWAITFFLLAAAFGFWGSMPVRGRPQLSLVSDCREYESNVIAVKSRWLWIAGLTLLVGLLIAFSAMLAKTLCR